LKDVFHSNGIPYADHDISHDLDMWDALKNRTGSKTVPYVFIDDEYIGGYSDFVAKHKDCLKN
jgi:glutaredoxin 3